MSRSERRDFVTVVCCAVLLAVILVLYTWSPVHARLAVECWWAGSTLKATGLPTDREFGITSDGYPHGVWLTTDDGTFSQDVAVPAETTFYTRGGGGAIFKFDGKQLGDYHPQCVAIP